jgi:hypothetical protein
MKGLAWYSGIVVVYSVVSCGIEALQGMSMSINLWAVVIYAPVIVFFVNYLRKNK